MKKVKSNMSKYISCSHLSAYIAHKDRYEIANKIVKYLKVHKYKFDTIVICGWSGILTGFIVAYLLKKEIIFVRKKQEKAYSSYKCEGYNNSKKYLIIDDFISTGATIKHIKKQLKNELDLDSDKCIGFLSVRNLLNSNFQYPYSLQNIDKY